MKVYKIKQIASELQVKTCTIRYWEKRFNLTFKKLNGQRIFKEKDLNVLTLIKNFLHGEGYTIEGAKQLLKGRVK